MPLRLDLNTKLGRAAKSCLEGGAFPPFAFCLRHSVNGMKMKEIPPRKAIAHGES